MAQLVVKRAASGIFDQYRGVFVNRGVFLKAPPDFFASYPSNFENPPYGWEKLNVKVRTIEHWDKQRGLLPAVEPKVEVPAPAPTPVSEVVVAAPQAVAEVVAEAPKTEPALASGVAGDVVNPPKRRGRRPKAAL